MDELLKRLQALGGEGFNFWVSRDAIRQGEWAAHVTKGIRASEVVMLCITAASVESQQVSRELSLACELGKPIVPVMLDDVRLPDTWQLLIGPLHYHALFRPHPSAMTDLARGLREAAGHVEETASPPPRQAPRVATPAPTNHAGTRRLLLLGFTGGGLALLGGVLLLSFGSIGLREGLVSPSPAAAPGAPASQMAGSAGGAGTPPLMAQPPAPPLAEQLLAAPRPAPPPAQQAPAASPPTPPSGAEALLLELGGTVGAARYFRLVEAVAARPPGPLTPAEVQRALGDIGQDQVHRRAALALLAPHIAPPLAPPDALLLLRPFDGFAREALLRQLLPCLARPVAPRERTALLAGVPDAFAGSLGALLAEEHAATACAARPS